MNELVQWLSEGDHPVILGGQQPSLNEFRKRIEVCEFGSSKAHG